jgi:hypothetical protein
MSIRIAKLRLVRCLSLAVPVAFLSTFCLVSSPSVSEAKITMSVGPIEEVQEFAQAAIVDTPVDTTKRRKELEAKIKDLDVNDPNFQKTLSEYEKELEKLREQEKQAKPEQPKRQNLRPNLNIAPLGLNERGIADPDLIMQEMMKQMLELQKNGGAIQGLDLLQRNPLLGMGRPMQPRLGVQIEVPSPVLAEQLNLPEDQGLVISEVRANTVAAKAGMKVNDVILQFNGTPIASDVPEFVRMVREFPSDKAFDIEVLRKGKKETIKGLKLPTLQANLLNPIEGLPNLAPLMEKQMQLLEAVAPQVQGVQGMSIQINNDRFTVRTNTDGKTIVIKGKIEGGEKVIESIQIQDGVATIQGKKIEDLPAEQRPAVEAILKNFR